MTQEELEDLIALGEGFTTELKRSGSSNLGREICAFANATGGVILIGVADDGTICSVGDHNRLKSQIQSVARSAEPPIAVEVDSAGEVLCVTIPAQQSKPYSFGGKFFIREGATSQQMSRDEIREFFYKEGLIHFDETSCSRFDLASDLTAEVWDQFVKRAKLPEGLDMHTVLRNLHLVKEGQMTHAGAWLLADDITSISVSASVTCALFRGTHKAHILDRKEFTGDLYSIYMDCMDYLQSKLNTALIPHATGRDERLELPVDALREAVVNAIAHRDYRSTANVQIYIFHDRVEIVTPGGLPAGMREEDLGVKSVPRNPLLFGIFHRMDLVEHIGSGIRRIRDLCRDYGVAEPKIEVSDSWVTMTFIRPVEKAEDQVAGEVTGEVAREVTGEVCKLLGVCFGAMSRAQLQEKLGLKAEENFRALYLTPALETGLIEMTIPDKPRSSKQKYRLTEKGRALADALQRRKRGEE
jgi:ATP-dependent DNA helicase RecG